MRRYWAVPELREFRLLYPHTTMRELMARFKRTRSALKNLAVKLGLRKTKEHVREHCRLNPGHPAWGWNRGKHYQAGGRAKETQFKPGQRGPRQRPVGAERVSRDGVEIKVAEPGVWMPKPRFVWEQHFGQIPAGAIVRLKDGNPQNCAPENLLLVTRSEHVRLNWKPRRAAAKPVGWTGPVRVAA